MNSNRIFHGDMATLITGATGFVGRELIEHLLEADPGLRVIALVRAADDVVADRRRTTLIAALPPASAARVEVLRGDMTAPRLGLDARRWSELVERTERVVHCAASTRFDLGLDRARLENVDSTAHVIELCRAVRSRGRSGRLDHVSTAFVAGRRQGTIGEQELVAGQSFRNTYEQTKLEAEILCRRAMGEIPVAIHRPSIVVGRRSSGETTSYKAAYGPMRLLINAYNTCPRVLNRAIPLPLPPTVSVDLVPVDYVAAAMAAIFGREDAIGRCFHLAAGPEGSATIRELVHIACDYFGTPRLRFVEPGAVMRAAGRAASLPLRRLAPRVGSVLSIMYSYGLAMPSFDTTQARAIGLEPPSVRQYFEMILRFASTSRFGQVEPDRQRTSRAPVREVGAPLSP